MGKEIKIGIFTLLTLGIVIWGYLFVVGNNILADNNSFHAYYDNVKDLTVASPVMVNGYEVGAVTQIILTPEDVNKIRVEFDVKSEIGIPKNTKALLKALNPINGKFIDLKFEKMCSGGDCLQSGSEIKGSALGLISSMVDTEEVSEYATAIGTSLNSTIGKLGAADSDAPLDASIRNLEIITENLTKVTRNLNSVLYNSKDDLNATFKNMASISSNLNANNEKITSMISNLNTASRQFAEVKLSETVSKTNTTIDQAGASLAEIEKTMTEAQKSVATLNEIMAKVNDGNGTLSRLINDQQLYDNMEKTSRNLSLLLQDLRLNPSRYVKVSVFGGKNNDAYVHPDDDPAIRKKN